MLFAMIFLFLMIRNVSAATCGGATTCNCGDTLTSSYTMISDLTGCTGDGIIIGTSNVILDCQGYTINGNNPGYPYIGINNAGVMVGGYWQGGYDNVTIKNCIITGGFYSGIFFLGASYGNIINNTARSNEYGFHVYQNSIYDNLINNTAINNILGFRIAYTSYDTLVGNIANNNNDGIGLDAPSYINVINNTANNNNYNGIGVYNNNYNNLTNNIANNNGGNGITIVGADYSNTINNTANSNNVSGIYLTGSSNNTITNNTANNAGYGIYVTGSTNNTFANNVFNSNTNASVYLEGPVYYINRCTGNSSSCYQPPCSLVQFWCNNNVVCSGCVWGPGVPAYPVGNDVFTNNMLTSGTCGFDIKDIINNSFTNNIITGNSYGIRLNQTASNNSIYNNYFNNSINAMDTGNNFWNTAKNLGTNIIGGPYIGGNYWNDYSGVDTNGDGLGNTKLPYNSSGSIVNGGDYLPLTIVNIVTPPNITIISPQNKSYGTNATWMNVTLNKAASMCFRSLDNGPNVSMTNSSGNWNNKITYMPDGSHNVKFYCNDTQNNWAYNTTSFFYCYSDITGPIVGVPDGTVNMRDINLLIMNFNYKCGESRFNPFFDVNDDCTVNMRDINIAIMNFNKICR